VIHPRRGYLLVFAGAAFFGVNASVSKVVLDAGVEPARLAALRCTGAAIGLGLVLAVLRPSTLRISRREVPALAALGLFGAALIQWFYFVAIDRLPVGIALLLEFTGPLLVALWSAVVLRHVVPRRVWLALGIALLGLALVAQVWRDIGLDPLGVAAGLGGAACLATFQLLGKQTVERRDPLSLAFWMFAFAAVFWAVAQPWWAFEASSLSGSTSMLGRLDDLSVPVLVALAWVVVLGTLAPYACYLGALRHLSPTTAGVVGMVEPAIAALVAWVWLEQVLNGVQLLGGALILVGVGLVQTASQPEELAPEPYVAGEVPAA
jgi:drug/metabolite transporter (DMT)-like permease